MNRPTISTEQRRARLGVRHRLAPAARCDDVAAIADSMVALHSSDPVTVYLSAAVRMVHPSLDAVSTALYDDHTVIRHHAMRRTLWVMTPEVAALAHAAATTGLVGPERKRLVRLLEAGAVAEDGEAWLDGARRDTVAALRRLGAATARRLGAEVPSLTSKIEMAPGKSYGASVSAHTRVLTLLGFEGAIGRGRPTGSWINGQYTWMPLDSLVPGGFADTDPAAARIELVRRWLYAFGPASTEDVRWWLGSTVRATAAALGACGAVEVTVDHGPAWLLADDLEPVTVPEPWAALLPGLDPTTMGWKARDWYLGPHTERVFDRNGNGGPTVWVDGRIVGAWVQRADGEIVVRLLDGDHAIGREHRQAIDTAATALRQLIGDTRFSVRFPSPIQPDLLA